ncbi:sensor histidine kinase [uncultured Fibrobacter sp.]|uniref:sensor histidine kinase n=1 Tax=uncultured Fibrobacter sp. TaxID=261512 RepID=UPI0025F13710|nr:histidine kinase [uncultured Fibrobacter sp.]
MTEEMQKNPLVRFFDEKRSLFESLQEMSFERGEKKLIDILNSENEVLNYPVPTFVPVFLLWVFIILFPLMLIVDQGYFSLKEIDVRNILSFYVPLLLTLCIFQINQKFLVPGFIFKKRYLRYFISNIIFVLVALFIREVIFFLFDRVPGDSWGYFVSSYCFSAVKGHFTLWTVLSFVFFVGFICLICVAYHVMLRQIIRTFVKREQKRLALQYELDFLKSQLSPHFLFNTLNNISALIRIDPKKAESSMEKLSKLLRVMLYQTSDQYITLQEDVDILQKYASLERLRFDDNFDFRFDTQLENPDCKIDPLLVMPLVENAIKHCVNPMGGSFVHISIVQKGLDLEFHSENSNFPRKSQSKSSGLGLVMFEKRLTLLYDGRYEYTTSVENGVYKCNLKLKLRMSGRGNTDVRK